MQHTQPRRKSKAKTAVAVIIVVILIGALGAYFFVLAPRMSIVDSTHAVSPTARPLPEPLTHLQYTFNVTVKNSGILSGKATIVCEFWYVNSSDVTKTFAGSRVVSLEGGQQGEFTINVLLPWDEAISSIISQTKSWEVKLA
jgi:flagellar basal body-associated protein FliL